MRSAILVTLFATCAVLADGGSAWADGPASRVDPVQRPNIGIDQHALQIKVDGLEGCSTLATADRTDKLTSSGVELWSATPIGHPNCAAWVADFQLDKGSVNANSPLVQFDGRETTRETYTGNYTYYVKGLTQSQCTAYKKTIFAYRKKAGETAFSTIGGGHLVTSWDTGGLDGKGLGGPLCRLKPDASFKHIDNVTPPTATGAVDTYRIVLAILNPPGQVAIAANRVK